MLAMTDSASATPTGGSSYACDVDTILGVALFDASGLPQEYFITPEHQETIWIQMVFQALGLQSLLASAFNLDPLRHAIVRTKTADAVVIYDCQRFVSLLMQRTQIGISTQVNAHWIQWALEFEAEQLRTHPRFRAV